MNTALVGCGKMGGALLHGWLAQGVESSFDVLEPGGLPDFVCGASLRSFASAGDFVAHSRPDVLVLAVKPQVMDAVCASLVPAVGPRTLIVSIAAGRTIASFQKIFGAGQPVVRAMPNTPASIGKGMTVAVAGPGVSSAFRDRAERLLSVTGKFAWVEDEGLMDAVTAVSGSGPAYVFALIEVLARAGVQAGLPDALAADLARQTVIGAAGLAESEAQTSAETLRRNVTSPGGTTQAALDVLLAPDGLDLLFGRAVAAAVARGQALGRSG